MSDETTQACIFNIQRFSLHDGPGVRTTVFFKGCPLRCAWCANPESILPAPQILWTAKSCSRCGRCRDACPERAVSVPAVSSDGGSAAARVTVDHARCTACGCCAAACPAGALALSGKMYSLAEAVDAVMRDRDFYEESGGGVTLSGGEATMRREFVREFLRELRERGIHTALETNGFAGEDVFQELAGLADMLLFDVKHYDSAKHEAGTGVPNDRILSNLRRALAAGRDVLVRIPVIRGYNDSLDDARGFGALLSGMGVRRAHLLPFHQMGEGKYDSIGMAYSLRGREPLSREDLEAFRETFRAGGIQVIDAAQ